MKKRHKYSEVNSGRRTPVMSTSEKRIQKILVPIDFSLQSRKALEYASMLMRQSEASITLLHVVKPEVSLADYGYGPVIRQTADESLIKKARKKLDAMRDTKLGVGVHAATIVRAGMPDREIVRTARDLKIGLVVMGSDSLATSPGVTMGGVAQSVICLAPCPVLVMRGKNQTASSRQPVIKNKI